MPEGLRVLIVDDDKSTCHLLKCALETEKHQCLLANNFGETESVLRDNTFDVALLDVYLDNTDGLQLVKHINALQPRCVCVVMTAHPSLETVARSVSDGAIEYLRKPLLIDDLLALVRRVQNGHGTPLQVAQSSEPFIDSAMVGNSAAIVEVYRAIARSAPSDAIVLITGASGTGKELVARAIHAHSSRAAMPFIPVNCGSFPEAMLESELFGHEKGAFTGADKARRGLFEAADGGTLFLDEISETSASFQVQLLRVLQEGQIRRLGSNSNTAVNVRIVAATNRDLSQLITTGRFREDLYYRLSVITIALPTLNERREDIPLLARHFLEKFNVRSARAVSITDETLRLLRTMSWPGNVRELENLIYRLVILSSTGVITPAEVQRERDRNSNVRTTTGSEDSSADSGTVTLREAEKQHILQVLRDCGGNKSLAARRLGIERKTLYQKVARFGIDLQTGKF